MSDGLHENEVVRKEKEGGGEGTGAVGEVGGGVGLARNFFFLDSSQQKSAK